MILAGRAETLMGAGLPSILQGESEACRGPYWPGPIIDRDFRQLSTRWVALIDADKGGPGVRLREPAPKT